MANVRLLRQTLEDYQNKVDAYNGAFDQYNSNADKYNAEQNAWAAAVNAANQSATPSAYQLQNGNYRIASKNHAQLPESNPLSLTAPVFASKEAWQQSGSKLGYVQVSPGTVQYYTTDQTAGPLTMSSIELGATPKPTQPDDPKLVSPNVTASNANELRNPGLNQAQAQLQDEMVRGLTDEIFNRLFSNW